MVMVEQCGAVTPSCLRSLTAIREMVGDIDITAALLSGGVRGEARQEGGKGNVRDFEKHRYKEEVDAFASSCILIHTRLYVHVCTCGGCTDSIFLNHKRCVHSIFLSRRGCTDYIFLSR